MNHLKPIEPAEAVHALCDRIRADGIKSYTLHLELRAFEETRTPHDARRLANCLRHVAGKPELADAVLALTSERKS